MYYSYKTKKKKGKLFKILLLLPVLFCIYYFGTRYHQYFLFWKYTHNKISSKLNDVLEITDIDKRVKSLSGIKEICGDYCFKNQVSPESFLLMGEDSFFNWRNNS